MLGDDASIRRIATFYFTTIHRWLPIVSKRGFFTCLLNPLAERRTELILLGLCMKLCTNSPSAGDGDNDTTVLTLYSAAKRLYSETEASGPLSVHILQAGLLIAFYEMSQAIYPAAYLTVGACARYGLVLGIDKFSMSAELEGDRGPSLGSWDEVEEMRRLWWAVLSFDR